MANTYLASARLDPDTYRQELIDFLKNQNLLKDFDYAGSNISVLLDLLAKNTADNAFYLNMIGTEMFLDTAQLKESVVSHSKELNYIPRSRVSSSAIVNIALDESSTAGSRVIPKFTRFTATVGSNTLTYSTNEDVVAINDGSGTFIANNVEIFEGTIVTEFVTKVAANTRYVVSSANVDINSLEVFVTEGEADFTNTEFALADNLFNLTPSSEVFFLQGYGKDRYEVEFGNDVTGKNLVVGNIARLRYRDTRGLDGDNAKLFTPIDPNMTVSTVQRSTGGAERESLTSIRFNAPRVFSTQERAVTEDDYKALIRAKFPQIETLAVFGGEKANPPRFGKVFIVIKPFGSTVASDNLKAAVQDFIKTKTAITTETLMADADFIHIGIETKVLYNVTQTSLSEEQVKALTLNTILSYGNQNLTEFDKDFRYSQLTTAIDGSDDSIISNDTKVFAIKKLSPFEGETATYELEFNNEIKSETDFGLASVRSSQFNLRLRGTLYEAFFEDDQNGSIHMYSSQSGQKNKIQSNIGSVDYANGIVTLTKFRVDSYFAKGRVAFGDHVNVFAKINGSDITANKDKILLVETDDVAISVEGRLTND